jgi:hypothetical protein
LGVSERTPTASRKRTSRASKGASRTASKPLDDAQLKDAAEQLNAASIAATGEPISLRKLQSELRIGQVKATALRDALKPASGGASQGASGTTPESAPTGAPELPEARIPLVLGDPIRRNLAGVNGSTVRR